jgi:Zn-dependent M28 family amino/carboxypeptidase
MIARSSEERLAKIREVVLHLCSAECGGRAPGTKGSAAARARIIAELEECGVEPAGSTGYVQAVPASGATNVIGRTRGRGVHSDRYVLVAAHYDHLGAAGDHDAYWGADDNAAAVAIMLDVARSLSHDAGRLDRSVLFCAFDAEEPPWFMSSGMGSVHFVANPTVPLEHIDAMICMDLMGHALGSPELPIDVRGTFFVLGAEKSSGTSELVERASRGVYAMGLFPRRVDSDIVPALSDYHAFEEAGVPFLFLTCGRWRHYHATSDTPEKLDYPKILATADFLSELVVELTRRDDPVELRPHARDDRATLETLARLASLLAPHVASARMAERTIAALTERMRANGALSEGERMKITQLVLALESALE